MTWTKRMIRAAWAAMSPLAVPDLLRALLRGPCRVTHAAKDRFKSDRITPDQVVVSHRLIHVRAGRLSYTVEGEARPLAADDWVWVPAWSRRGWAARRGGCELCWCEFTTDPVEVPPGFYRVPAAGKVVAAKMAALARGWSAEGELAALRREAELKALAAEFWSRARPAEAAREAGPRHPEVARAAAWLREHFARPDALEAVYEGLRLSPNHFRLLFRRQTGETVQAMLARLRLRRARYLVAETRLSVKEIAAECGFADPLYFSNHYRRFWGRSPRADRGGVGEA